ncbi:MAG: nucleotidyltransferase family protein [Firmicutes bacterium]|nr:nucleotidyltransferase family protein [Bacillota bacterium]
MKTTVIICEFNPLHSGHKKLIDYAHTFSDRVICVMSGNFTQRGLPACANKFSRATHAILSGADLVVELPTVYAVASAENFSFGGVSIANSLKADYLLFGSECGDIDKLNACAAMLNDPYINQKIAEEMTKGVSYPKAVAIATKQDILNKPNNVLGVEYLKAIEKINADIVPVTVVREDNYNGEPQEYASSGALRRNANLRNIYTYDYVTKDIDDEIVGKYKTMAAQALSIMDVNYLRRIEGVTEGLENRIFNADKTQGFEKMIDGIKTKRYTRLKLQRIILNALLNITSETISVFKTQPPNVKALAVNENAASLLSLANNVTDEITSRADRFYSSLSGKQPVSKLIKV